MSSFAVAMFGGFLLLVLLLESAAAETVHVVGDSMGWTIPQNDSFYVNWASSNKFLLGDTLTFNFTTKAHDVLEVPKESFDSCSSENSRGNAITTGPANINLNITGNHYYICTFGNHCQRGQKLAITVSSASPPGASPTSPPTPTSSAPPAPSSSAAGVFASMSLVLLSIAVSMLV